MAGTMSPLPFCPGTDTTPLLNPKIVLPLRVNPFGRLVFRLSVPKTLLASSSLLRTLEVVSITESKFAFLTSEPSGLVIFASVSAFDIDLNARAAPGVSFLSVPSKTPSSANLPSSFNSAGDRVALLSIFDNKVLVLISLPSIFIFGYLSVRSFSLSYTAVVFGFPLSSNLLVSVRVLIKLFATLKSGLVAGPSSHPSGLRLINW